jgi:hypothetical protein
MRDGPFDRLPIPLEPDDDGDEIGSATDEGADLQPLDFSVSPRQLAVGGAVVAALVLLFLRSRRGRRGPGSDRS